MFPSHEQTLKDSRGLQQSVLTSSLGGFSDVLPNSPIVTSEFNAKLTYLTKTSWLTELVGPALPVLAQAVGLSTNMKGGSVHLVLIKETRTSVQVEMKSNQTHSQLKYVYGKTF